MQAAGYEDSLGSRLKSNPVKLQLSYLPTAASSGSSGSSAGTSTYNNEVMIVLQNTAPLDYALSQQPFIETECLYDDYSIHDYACANSPTNQILSVACNGSTGTCFRSVHISYISYDNLDWVMNYELWRLTIELWVASHGYLYLYMPMSHAMVIDHIEGWLLSSLVVHWRANAILFLSHPTI